MSVSSNINKQRDYAICKDKCSVQLLTTRATNLYDTNGTRNLLPGMMVYILEYHPDNHCSIQLTDNIVSLSAHDIYFCKVTSLIIVTSDVWPFLLAIALPYDRLNYCKDYHAIEYLRTIEIDDEVSVRGHAFTKQNVTYDCIVRNICMVPEFGPGYYFCLEILNNKNGFSPQREDIKPYVCNYMQCDLNYGLIVAANWLKTKSVRPIDKHTQNDSKKLSPFNFVNDFLCGNNTLERKHSNSTKNTNSITQYQSLDSDDIMYPATASSSFTKQDYVNDDYAKYIENHERSVEKNHSNSSTLKSTKGKSKQAAASSKPTSTILSLEDRDLVVIDTQDIKESTSNESDVIILDPPILRTPTPPPPPQQTDLKDLLGSDWPMEAGDVANLLNTSNSVGENTNYYGGGTNNSHQTIGASTSSSYNYNNRKSERVKSMNPLSHIMSGSRATEKRQTVNSNRSSLIDGNVRKELLDTLPIYDNSYISGGRQPIGTSSASDDDGVIIKTLPELPNSNLTIGSMVEVNIYVDSLDSIYGVIRWIGEITKPHKSNSKNLLVGIELEDEPSDKSVKLTDGTHYDKRLFKCPSGRALFISPSLCTKDKRFHDDVIPPVSNMSDPNYIAFGHVECPIVTGSIPPLELLKQKDLEDICGQFKGIQGHHNSCYLDATLFAMFTFTSVFDSLLYRPPEPEDNAHYEEVQKVLREEIVNPLRKNHFVRADRVMKLRHLLDKLSSVTGLTSEEKDPEEFINSLLAQILRADPFLKLSSGLDAFYYQLFVEKDERLTLPTVQQLFEQSFLTSDIKLKEVPSCLIIQMPRFGKNYKMYPRILPTQLLDVTDIIEDSPRQCTICGKLAEFECRECFGDCGAGLESTSFCQKCLETIHTHAKRSNHTPKPISVPHDFKIMAEHVPVPRLYMELFAVVCIETSHYVAFVKAGSGEDAPWCFFDSMADRRGEQNGFNIPKMLPVADLPIWLSEEGARALNDKSSKMLPEHAKRLFCDAYMCMYQSTDVRMYR